MNPARFLKDIVRKICVDLCTEEEASTRCGCVT